MKSKVDTFEQYIASAERDRESFRKETRDSLAAINHEMHQSFKGFTEHLNLQDTKFGKAWGAIMVIQVVVLPILWLFLKK